MKITVCAHCGSSEIKTIKVGDEILSQCLSCMQQEPETKEVEEPEEKE